MWRKPPPQARYEGDDTIDDCRYQLCTHAFCPFPWTRFAMYAQMSEMRVYMCVCSLGTGAKFLFRRFTAFPMPGFKIEIRVQHLYSPNKFPHKMMGAFSRLPSAEKSGNHLEDRKRSDDYLGQENCRVSANLCPYRNDQECQTIADYLEAYFRNSFSHLSLPALAELVREVGLDTTNLVVRGRVFRSRRSIWRRSCRCFLRIMRREGLEIHFRHDRLLGGDTAWRNRRS